MTSYSFTKRQLLLGAAGVGLTSFAAGAIITPKGTNDQHGPDPVPIPTQNFAPASLCVVYMKFDITNMAPRFIAKHAWFEVSSGNYNDHLRDAIGKIPAVAAGTLTNMPLDAKRFSQGFNAFNFGGKSRIYIYIDNGDDVIFDKKNMIHFTKYAADRDLQGRKREMNKNRAFKVAKHIPRSETNLSGDLLYMENHHKRFWNETMELGDEDIGNAQYPPYPHGHTQKRPFLEYSMNIHLQMKMPDNSYIPLVIDPNTGNGGGWEP